MNNMRDRLIELLKAPHKAEQLRNMGIDIYNADPETIIADYLLANSVIAPPCKVGDKVAVRALCECVITTPSYEECRHICPFEDACDCEECSSLNERIFDTKVTSIFNNGEGWYIEFEHLIPFARFTDIGTSFFVGLTAHEQAIAYCKAQSRNEREEND